MKGVKYLIAVTHREFSEQYLDFFRRHGVERVLKQFANGTASESMLDYFGIKKTDKIMFKAMVPEEKVEEIKEGLLAELNIGGVGNGLGLFLPTDGFGGESAKKYFLGDKEIVKRENANMGEELSNFVLIIAVADKGNTDKVMDAARSGGATGGTVVKALGTGAEIAKFFGIAISDEKEMIYIVAKRTERDAIMHAIMEKAGRDTDAHGVAFSLPVESVVGIRNFEN